MAGQLSAMLEIYWTQYGYRLGGSLDMGYLAQMGLENGSGVIAEEEPAVASAAGMLAPIAA